MLPSDAADHLEVRSRLAWLTTTPFGSEVEPEVYCRNAMSSRPARGSRWARGRAGVEIDREPLQLVVARKRSADPRAARSAELVSANAGAQLAMMLALESRALCRRGTIIGTAMTPRDQAAEERDDEVEARRKDQQRAIAGAGDVGEPRRERRRGVVQLAKGQRRFLGAAIGQKDVGAIVGLRRGAMLQKRHQRGNRLHFRER